MILDTKTVRISTTTAFRILRSTSPMSREDRDEVLSSMKGKRQDTEADSAFTLTPEIFEWWQKDLTTPPPSVDEKLWKALQDAFILGLFILPGENFICRS